MLLLYIVSILNCCCCLEIVVAATAVLHSATAKLLQVDLFYVFAVQVIKVQKCCAIFGFLMFSHCLYGVAYFKESVGLPVVA